MPAPKVDDAVLEVDDGEDEIDVPIEEVTEVKDEK